jgi:hypothetical protein
LRREVNICVIAVAICMLVIVGTTSAAYSCSSWKYSDDIPEGMDIDFDIECIDGNLHIIDNSSGILDPGIKTIQIWPNATSAQDDNPDITWSIKSPMSGPFQDEFSDGTEFEIDQAKLRSTGLKISGFENDTCPDEIKIAIHIRWVNENGEEEYAVLYATGTEGELSSVWAFAECTSGGIQEIPEFPTVALPIAAIIGLAFMLQRRKE